MKSPSYYFQKMSLTRQILTIITTVLVFFLVFFFIYVSDNIDRTINRQMYEMIMNRQEPIAELIESNKKNESENVYSYLALDTVQTNCIIQNGKITILSNQKNQFVNQKVYDALLEQSQLMNKDTQSVLQGTASIGSNTYYYRLMSCNEDTILASFMDDTYATQFRDSLIDSTVYVIVLAFMIVFLIILKEK